MSGEARTLRMPDAWDRASPRERVALVVAAVVVAGAVLWAFAWQPLTRDLATLREQAPRDAATLATARFLANDIAGLERAAPPARGDLRSDVERTLAANGFRAPAITLEVTGDRLRVTAPVAAFATLATAVDAVRKDAGAFIVEATVTPRVEPGTVRAELVFAR